MFYECVHEAGGREKGNDGSGTVSICLQAVRNYVRGSGMRGKTCPMLPRAIFFVPGEQCMVSCTFLTVAFDVIVRFFMIVPHVVCV